MGGAVLLVAFYLAGEGLVRLVGVPFPGSLAGMLLMLGWLCLRGRAETPVDEVATAILRRIGLVFVPSAVGVSLHLGALARAGVPVLVVIVAGGAAALVAAGWAFQVLNRREES